MFERRGKAEAGDIVRWVVSNSSPSSSEEEALALECSSGWEVDVGKVELGMPGVGAMMAW